MSRRFGLGAAVIAFVAATAALLWWLLAARAPDVAPAARASSEACSAASGRYPASLGRLERGSLDVTSAAAYGDPQVIVRCGVAALGPTDDECVAVDDVDWVVTPLSDGTRVTTYGRDPAIEVLVPTAHSPAPLLLPALSDAARMLPKNGRACAG